MSSSLTWIGLSASNADAAAGRTSYGPDSAATAFAIVLRATLSRSVITLCDSGHGVGIAGILLAGDTPSIAYALEFAPDEPFDMRPIMFEAHIGCVKGLMIRGYPDGVGTTLPGE